MSSKSAARGAGLFLLDLQPSKVIVAELCFSRDQQIENSFSTPPSMVRPHATFTHGKRPAGRDCAQRGSQAVEPGPASMNASAALDGRTSAQRNRVDAGQLRIVPITTVMSKANQILQAEEHLLHLCASSCRHIQVPG